MCELAEPQSKAVRDGDDWILNGQKIFISGHGDPDWLYGPLITDPDAPRHRNLGYFMVPYPAEGLAMERMGLLTGHDQSMFFMDNVRVQGDHLVGQEGQGWQVSQTTLEVEHGGRGIAFPLDESMDNLLTYVKGTRHNGGGLGDDPVVQQDTMDALLDTHVHTLLAQRNYSMYQANCARPPTFPARSRTE